jgi:hypothetical protein
MKRQFAGADIDSLHKPLGLPEIQAAIEDAILPAHFYERVPGRLSWEHRAQEESAWEIFQGRLLDARQTRNIETFEAWSIYWHDTEARSDGPLISVKLSLASRHIYVTRAIYCYAFEGYHAGDNVYLSREVCEWIPELVGTIRLDRYPSIAAIKTELARLLFHAVVGSSRLPLTSVEAPLPGFSLGEIAYFYRSDKEAKLASAPMRNREELLGCLGDHLDEAKRVKLVETTLRGIDADEVAKAAARLARRWDELAWPRFTLISLFRRLFNEVALSPYTGLVHNSLGLLNELAGLGWLSQENVVDFESYLLRLTARHLTAYDLFTYHHRGANYPDAILLDEVLRSYLEHIRSRSDLFLGAALAGASPRQQVLRRRALRQATVLWLTYRDLPVPDLPTSPGENARILPAPLVRVPDEQITSPAARSKHLFAGATLSLDDPAIARVWARSLADLERSDEFRELGTAIYLDRPLGVGKAPAEPDQTPLLSYEMFSQSLAQERLRFLQRIVQSIDTPGPMDIAHAPAAALSAGIPLQLTMASQRPGVVALEDALKMAPDFVVLRTTRCSAQAFLTLFDFAPLSDYIDLNFLDPGDLTIIRANAVGRREPNILLIFDAADQKRIELAVDLSQGYTMRDGIEVPAAGLRVLRLWTEDATHREPDLTSPNIAFRS